MEIDIENKKHYIEVSDLVYSEIYEYYGFVCLIDNKYYFVDNNSFENYSSSYDNLNNLICNLKLELIAKNEDLKISLKY